MYLADHLDNAKVVNLSLDLGLGMDHILMT